VKLTGLASAKKKKKKSKKKKTGAANGASKQSSPPRVGLSKLFPSGQYPIGEIRDYTDEYHLISFHHG
jgi:methionyl aminopeptidase